ncbi:MAG: beta-galactosidase [Acidobacteriaceae bacterium]|nr:beta-galactosidase [Acidobacteriaceae bacterium]
MSEGALIKALLPCLHRGNEYTGGTPHGAGAHQSAVGEIPELIAAGADTTRVTFRITYEYVSIRRLCNDPIEAEGPAILLGPKLFGLTGGTGAVWIRARQTPGCVRVTATHSVFGARSIEIALMASPKESV